jgi:hypothetical protein
MQDSVINEKARAFKSPGFFTKKSHELLQHACRSRPQLLKFDDPSAVVGQLQKLCQHHQNLVFIKRTLV